MSDKLGHLVINRAPLTYITFFGVLLIKSVFLLSFYMAWWIAALSSILIAFVLSEILFRLTLFLLYGFKYIYKIRPYILVDDPVYGYRLRKNADVSKVQKYLYEKYAFNPTTGVRVDLTTGPNGFRGERCLDDKENNTYRIYCSGGSTTVGYGVDDDETWPFQLEKILNSNNSGREYQITNGGVYGWNSTQELIRIKEVVDKFDIDGLILHQGWNEEYVYSTMSTGEGWNNEKKGDYYSRYYFFSEKFKWINPFVSLVLPMKCLKRDRLLRNKLSFYDPSRWSNLKHDEYIEAWLNNLLSVVEICKSRSIDLWIVKAPSMVSVDDTMCVRKRISENSRMSLLHAEYQSIAKARIDAILSEVSGFIPVIDASSNFASICVEDKFKYFLDEMHLTKIGELRLAEIISCKLKASVDDSAAKFLDKQGLKDRSKRIVGNSPDLNERINKIWTHLCSSSYQVNNKISVPEDRYTTH